MIRRPPRSTQSRSSAASDVYKRQVRNGGCGPWAQFKPIPIEPQIFKLESHSCPGSFLGAIQTDTEGGNFVLVDGEDESAVWSFYPEGCASAIEFEAPKALATPREVYAQFKENITSLADNTGIDIQLADPPEDESDLIAMLNRLHDFLPHPVQRIAMKKIGLRVFEMPTPVEEDEAPLPEEWDMLLQDLQEMGFHSEQSNLQAVKVADGNLKHAVKFLVAAERQ
eukprot:TRINITY_DN1104_c0_g3_i11.p1 TRINITY_DN1104_c0_g3~~TRINITY_DN1104_c0_g3_i11.p1  ORF type:complete len:225 (-),score=114.53 TRINITY_DN1104_c0_g3_i11:287-961(-)